MSPLDDYLIFFLSILFKSNCWVVKCYMLRKCQQQQVVCKIYDSQVVGDFFLAVNFFFRFAAVESLGSGQEGGEVLSELVKKFEKYLKSVNVKTAS